MKTVWLLRHAKSSWDDGALADHDRPLASRGRKAAKRIRDWAGEHGVRPQLVLCSTALRARDTLERVLPGLGDPEVELESGVYHATAETLMERLRRLPSGADSVMLVGHNPGLEDLASELAPPGPDALPTAALAELRLEIEDWRDVRRGCGLLERLVLPRSLSS